MKTTAVTADPEAQDVVDTDVTPETAEPKRQPLADVENKVVRFVGAYNERHIFPDQWKGAIGREHKQISWFRDAPMNDVPLSEFDLTAHEFQRCILADQDLRLVTLET